MTDEEEMTAQLLRLAGAPIDPPAERAARVHEAVHREWRVTLRRRVIRRGAAIALVGVAASLAIAIVMNRSRATLTPGAPDTRVVATGQRIQGRPLIVHRDRRGDDPQLVQRPFQSDPNVGPFRSDPNVGRPFQGRQLTVSSQIHAGEVIETDEASRAALQTADGSSVRVDRASRVRFVTPAAIEVIAGAVYVATSDGSRGFEVRTALGSLRDVGTQFEVRLTGSSLRLRVRSGRIEIARGSGVATAVAGTETTVTSAGIAVRNAAAYGSEWVWAADVAPSFAIEGQPLHVFLEHTAAEQGWTLRYAAPDVADAARRTILHGSVDGLKAEDALGVALTTSGLEYRLIDGELRVSRPESAR